MPIPCLCKHTPAPKKGIPINGEGMFKRNKIIFQVLLILLISSLLYGQHIENQNKITCSNVLDSLLEKLVKDGYELKIDTNKTGVTEFKRCKPERTPIEPLVFEVAEEVSIYAKRKKSITKQGPKYFPKFILRRITFNPDADMQQIVEKIKLLNRMIILTKIIIISII